MATTPSYINQRINNLQSQINSIISGGGGGVPTSSDLADVLVNGNSAGTTDINMNFNDITNVNEVVVLNPTFFTTSVQPQQTIVQNITTTETATLNPIQVGFTNATGNSSYISNNAVVIADATNSLTFQTTPSALTMVNTAVGSIASLDVEKLQFLGSNTTNTISNSGGQDLVFTADGVLQLGSVANIANFSTYNINNFGYALPICFTRSRTDSFTYNFGGQTWENVYTTSVNVPSQLFTDSATPYTSSYWKIDFALNCYQNSNLGDKGLAMYIEFEDQSITPYLPIAYNLNTPYAVWQPASSFTNAAGQPFQNFNWSDLIDFAGLTGTGSGNVPLNMKLWVAGDSSFGCNFNMVMTLTRTNLV
jgi:hypothetical protein